MAKVLLFDIETSPNLSYTWGKWQQDVVGFKKEWEILSFAYKWLGERAVHVRTRPDTRGSEKALVGELWKLLDSADVVVAHNGDAFDNKKARAKFIEHSFPPPSPFRTVDTLKIARSQFKFNGNKLDDLGQTLQLGRKAQTGGFKLWLGCMANAPQSWKQLAAYNKQDVRLLEKVYLRLRPWMPRHPNVAITARPDAETACPACASPNVIRKGYLANSRTLQQKWLCKDCGHWHTTAIKREAA